MYSKLSELLANQSGARKRLTEKTEKCVEVKGTIKTPRPKKSAWFLWLPFKLLCSSTAWRGYLRGIWGSNSITSVQLTAHTAGLCFKCHSSNIRSMKPWCLTTCGFFFLLFKLQFLMNFIRSLPSLADAAPIRGTHVKELGPKSSTKGRILHRLLARSLLTPIPAVAHVSVSITAFSSWTLVFPGSFLSPELKLAV